MEKLAQFREQQASNARANYYDWQLLNSQNIHRRHLANLSFQKCTTQWKRSCQVHEDTKLAAKIALEFSEKQKSWSKVLIHDEQAWDGLENANNWEMLTKKRETERDSIEKLKSLEYARFALFQAEMDEACSSASTKKLKVIITISTSMYSSSNFICVGEI